MIYFLVIGEKRGERRMLYLTLRVKEFLIISSEKTAYQT
jgi:hypothetical protein